MSGERTQEQEMRETYDQKRQPNCIYCNSPLDEVRQLQENTARFVNRSKRCT